MGTYLGYWFVSGAVSTALCGLYPLDLCASEISGLAGWLKNKRTVS